MSRAEIWVVCETWEGVLVPASLELVGEGSRLARQSGYILAALVCLPGEGGSESALGKLAETLASWGADRILALESPESADDGILTGMISEAASAARPEVLLMSATIFGRSVMPRVAARLGTGLTADCTGLFLDADGLLLQTRPAYGDNLLAEVICPHARPQMATLRPGVFPPPCPLPGREAEILRVRHDRIDPGLVRLLSATTENEGGKSLIEARIVVAGGRGIGSAEAFRELERLAQLLGGAAGASRSAVEAGFAPYSRQIGQTGVTIRPELYIACGISGSIQHRAGMSGSKRVIAINADRGAPIFDYADYGIVGDLQAIVGMMIRYIEDGAIGSISDHPRATDLFDQAGPGIP